MLAMQHHVGPAGELASFISTMMSLTPNELTCLVNDQHFVQLIRDTSDRVSKFRQQQSDHQHHQQQQQQQQHEQEQQYRQQQQLLLQMQLNAAMASGQFSTSFAATSPGNNNQTSDGTSSLPMALDLRNINTDTLYNNNATLFWPAAAFSNSDIQLAAAAAAVSGQYGLINTNPNGANNGNNHNSPSQNDLATMLAVHAVNAAAVASSQQQQQNNHHQHHNGVNQIQAHNNNHNLYHQHNSNNHVGSDNVSHTTKNNSSKQSQATVRANDCNGQQQQHRDHSTKTLPPANTTTTTTTTSTTYSSGNNKNSPLTLPAGILLTTKTESGHHLSGNDATIGATVKKHKGEFDEPTYAEVDRRRYELETRGNYHSLSEQSGNCACILGSKFETRSPQAVLKMVQDWKNMSAEQRLNHKWDAADLPRDIPLAEISKYELLRKEASGGMANFGGTSKRKPLGIRGTRQFLLILYCLWGHPGSQDKMQREGYCPHCFAKIKKPNDQSTLVRVVNHFNMKHRQGHNPRLSPVQACLLGENNSGSGERHSDSTAPSTPTPPTTTTIASTDAGTATPPVVDDDKVETTETTATLTAAAFADAAADAACQDRNQNHQQQSQSLKLTGQQQQQAEQQSDTEESAPSGEDGRKEILLQDPKQEPENKPTATV
ncbi:hypothetical protein GZH46_00785, partial [Fragariocoptes setiger]